MKALFISILIASTATGTAALAQAQSNRPATPGTAQLRQALTAVAVTAASASQSARPVDPDQGDDNANPRAILRVCNKSTPAAERSAICPVGVSPD